ncbi:MAG TPA: carboxypeptidase regulatory-like domain-containing protein [Methanocorpusculum sp.]|nr:carboxypeptidase regulatory-like domain-containing protein [Methanocorpusculum sp.]HJK45802.1 carboxypeptidase regulatory-like domain-containing protein [Methanocorpusculum sp.]HJK53112.1 carboxypeptidase regulatory-like domain-containing protein [Methanocorpusculum sp.]HJK69689.1 carboxypeptidase regulatory-like domain-containing protein [Methanocorpusculum sp.]HJK73687.1 carboxypeptidase regulatory-like domain-containing protein [Methanocorpusculum sp.]
MSIKHLVAVLLLASLLFCGIAAAAEATSLTINVYDNSAAHDPVKDAKVVITKSGTSLSQTLYTTSDGIVEFPSVEYKSTYSVTVTKDGFDEQKFSIDVNTMGKEYTVYLQKSNLVQVKVLNTDKSTPVAGAEISVDGLAMGTTNSAGVLHVSMEKGVYHNIQVTADSYETYTSSQYIETDQTSLTITLSKSYFSPRILVYDADNDMKPVSLATVIIDGKTVGTTDEYGRATLNDLTAGTYTLEVTKPNYNSYKNTVTFTEDSSDVIVELTYAVVPLTVLVVDGNNPVAGATIYIDNLVTGLTDTTGKFTKDVEPGKTILITASKDGYATQSISWSVTADQNNTVTVPITQNFPVALVGGIIAVIIIIGVVVFLVKAKGSSDNRGRKGSI